MTTLSRDAMIVTVDDRFERGLTSIMVMHRFILQPVAVGAEDAVFDFLGRRIGP